VLGCLVVILCCCFGIIIWWDGYYLPYKYCRPVTYPDGNMNGLKEGKWFSTTTTASVNSVMVFYDERLLTGEHSLGDINLGEWHRKELQDGRLLYECVGIDINLLTVETGCIYISKQNEGTYIESWFLRSEGGTITCSRIKN